MTTTATQLGTARPGLLGEVSASRVQALPQGSFHILDVRSAGEYRTSHIPGAVNVPLEEIGRFREQLSQVREPLVVVCEAGSRAAQACKQLSAAGKDVQVLSGGMVAWQQARGEVERGEQTWSLERQVRLVAGSLVLAGVLSSTLVPRLKWLSAAVGGGLTFAAVSNTCMMGNVLAKLPYNRGSRADVEQAVKTLAA